MRRLQRSLFLVLLGCAQLCEAQVLAVFKYDGGGDWYANPTALKNLSEFYNKNTDAKSLVHSEPITVESLLASGVSFLHGTGHGRIILSEAQASQLRTFTENGGFLHIDDNYGMELYVTKELKKVFPNKELIEIPKTHPIFKTAYDFPNGLPKIHEHDGKAPKAMGVFHKSRLILLFTFESDLGDGWEDQEVHNDPEDVRQKALKMGANIMKYVFIN